MEPTQPHAWNLIARTLHWLMALMIFGQILLGNYAEDLSRSPEKINLMMWHKSVGITVLVLLLVRIGVALVTSRPEPPLKSHPVIRKAAFYNQLFLYALMAAIPVSGWLMNSAKNIPFSVYRIFPWPKLIQPDEKLAMLFNQIHEGLVKLLLLLLIVHISAAFWHHFYLKDNTLRQMGFRGD